MNRSSVLARVLRAGAATALLGLSAVLTVPGAAHAVANGTDVAEGQYRFATKLTMTNIPRADGTTYDSACSGALVAPQWVITAGHCFHSTSGARVSGAVPYPTTATLGRADLSATTGYVVDVVEVRQASRQDVALVKLATPVTDIAPLPYGFERAVRRHGGRLPLRAGSGNRREVRDREMNGAVDVYQRDDGRIYVASSSRTPDGPMVVNGWCEMVGDDVTDDRLGALVQEGLRVGEEPRHVSLDDTKELLRPLLKLAKVRSFAALTRGARAVGFDRDAEGSYVVVPTGNAGERSGFMFVTKDQITIPPDSSAGDIGRAVREGLSRSVISTPTRSKQ